MPKRPKNVGRPTVEVAEVLVDREAIGATLRAGVSRRIGEALERHRQYQAGQGREPYGVPQLAQEIGASPEAVRTWIAGKHLPALDLVVAVAEVLQVPPAWLAFGG